MSRLRALVAALVAGAAVGALPTVSPAAAAAASSGGLDPTFGVNGLVTEPPAWANAVSVLPDGSILTGGSSLDPVGGGHLALLGRFLPDGSVDTSYGDAGLATFDGHGTFFDMAASSDGSVVVAATGGTPTSFMTMKVGPDGRIDSSFAQLTTNFGATDFAETVIPAPGGKWLVGGVQFENAGADLERLNADGSLDTTFGAGGKVTIPGVTGPYQGELAYQSTGKIVLTGQTGLLRLNADGSLDTTFGAGGHATLGVAQPLALTVLPDDSLVVLQTDWPDRRFELAGYTADGQPNPAFGIRPVPESGAGTPLGGDDTLTQSGGDLLVSVEYCVTSDCSSSRSEITRWDSAGNADSTFGVNGFVTFPRDIATIAVDNQGRILASGIDLNGYWFMARILNGQVVARLAGSDRYATAVAVSRSEFPTGGAGAVVLARGDDYPDALVGTALAAAKNAPILLTAGTALPASTTAEISRVLPAGGNVYVLGGTSAVPVSVTNELASMGYTVTRYGGVDRYATATAVADALGDPTTVLLATGTNFPDALSAGVAAAKTGGVVLLTSGAAMPSETSAYLAAHPGTVWAVGGPAAKADPSATAIVGSDRYATAIDVAGKFFANPTAVGVATGTNFPDALSGGALLAKAGGPLVLATPTSVPSGVAAYLSEVKGSVTAVHLFGGTNALGSGVQTAVSAALGK